MKEKYDNLNWYRITGLHNRIVHHYLGIDYSIVWETKEHFLPSLIISLKSI
ncbi:MAG: DUF86 domain-containing protein [Chitinophagales bacterium]|nr:DUF86 domain-containing protein [Chitinophagales bacterium]